MVYEDHRKLYHTGAMLRCGEIITGTVAREKRARLKPELHFNILMGFARRGLPLPLPQGDLGGLNQQRVTASYLDGLDCAVGRNYDLGLHRTLDLHGAGQVGILGSYLSDNLAGALYTVLSSKSTGSDNQDEGQNS